MAAADPDWFRRLCEADDAAAALAARSDADPAQILEAAQARYPLVYRDLDTALAEYASRPVMIGAAWLRWWFERHPPGSPSAGRLLDVGCGAGVLTCAYALARPDAEVVGIDAVPEAVACATELAGRLGAGNATFVVGDFSDASLGGGRFDELVAVTALGDSGVYPQEPPDARLALSSVADVDGPGGAFRSPGAERLVGRLAEGGSLLAFDRTPDVAQAVRFGAALLHAGIDLDLRRAGVELFVEEGRPTTFTRLAGVRSAEPATSDADLAAWIKGVAPPAYGPEWHAELRYEALKAAGARLVWGCEIDFAPHSQTLERREIWDDGGDVYGWVSTSPRLRELVVRRSAEDLWREYSGFAGQCAAGGLQVRFYDGVGA
jgi:SAM-dependent methyltransferase